MSSGVGSRSTGTVAVLFVEELFAFAFGIAPSVLGTFDEELDAKVGRGGTSLRPKFIGPPERRGS